MKHLLIGLILIGIVPLKAQGFRKVVPFKYQKRWGVVDRKNNEIETPHYHSINIFGDFLYAEFDGEDLYNLSTGEKTPSFGKFCASIEIEGETYHLFTNSEKSRLISLEKKDTISLSLRYSYMYVHQLYNPEGKEEKAIIFARLVDDNILFLTHDKELNTLINKRFENEEIGFVVQKEEKKIGLVVKEDGYFHFYNHQVKVIKKIKADDKTRYYNLLPSEIDKQIPEIYKVSDAEILEDYESVWDDSWDIERELLSTLYEKQSELDFYISYDYKSRDYFLKTASDEKFNLELNLSFFYYETKYKTAEIRQTKSLFFYDPKYMEMPNILFPRKYLKGD